MPKVGDETHNICAFLLRLGLLQVVAFLSYTEPFPAFTDALVDF